MWDHVASKRACGLRDFGPRARGIGLTGAFCRAMIIAVLLGATGCTKVGPDFEPPTAPKSEQWIDQNDGRVKTEESDYTTWWQVFNDPILNRLVETAYRQNLDLQTAARAIVLAAASNTLVKGGIVLSTGSAALRKVILPGLIATLATAIGVVFLL